MSKRLIVAFVLSMQIVALPLLISPASAQAGAAAGSTTGTGIGEGSISSNSARDDFEATQRAIRAGDKGATRLAGVMPILWGNPVEAGINPSYGGTGSGMLPDSLTIGWPATTAAPQATAPGHTARYEAARTVDFASFRSVTDCLNAASRAHASLSACQR
ncbi:MAG: hypothetical protein JO339_05995 [Alphaproteobacteria bacterium]|nr:hypothetical protein [Alphaproteobacteria bacterium]